ncbi:putative gustatory receptor 58b [Bactrocera tryoni]|uniref:putative gustatory receptor 58b n=1 Tax=Bactrocera tryoni TaxID=59916 RepID=UPI001A959D8C|nr:putative gustatory receptor 58b [Bactrocera tryoni]
MLLTRRSVTLSKHLRHTALRWVLRFSYYHAFGFGLLPRFISYKRPLRRPHHKLFYRLYTVAINLFCWAMYPVIVSRMTIHLVHIRDWLSVMFSMSVAILCKTFALVTMCIYIWFGQRRTVEVLRRYRTLRQRYRHLKRVTCPNQAQLEYQLLAKFFSANIGIVHTARIYFVYGKTNANAYKLLVLAQFLSNSFLIAGVHQFVYALYLLRQQFACVNELIRLWLCEVWSLKNIKDTFLPQFSKELNSELSARLLELDLMHSDYQYLTVRVFELFSLPFAGFLFRQFGISINILFSAVQFINNRIKVGTADDIIGTLLIVLFFTDALLLISWVNGVVHECNVSAELLRESTTLVSSCKHQAELKQQVR